MKHKFRVQLVPVHYAQTGDATVAADISAARRSRPACRSVPQVHWKAWRFGYEYDFVVATARLPGVHRRRQVHRRRRDAHERGRGTRAQPPPALRSRHRRNSARLPRARIWRLTGEADRLQDGPAAGSKRVRALPRLRRVCDVELRERFGVQFGYRSFDLDYTLTNDNGSFKLEGPVHRRGAAILTYASLLDVRPEADATGLSAAARRRWRARASRGARRLRSASRPSCRSRTAAASGPSTRPCRSCCPARPPRRCP